MHVCIRPITCILFLYMYIPYRYVTCRSQYPLDSALQHTQKQHIILLTGIMLRQHIILLNMVLVFTVAFMVCSPFLQNTLFFLFLYFLVIR